MNSAGEMRKEIREMLSRELQLANASFGGIWMRGENQFLDHACDEIEEIFERHSKQVTSK